jgi:hypothetical protein
MMGSAQTKRAGEGARQPVLQGRSFTVPTVAVVASPAIVRCCDIMAGRLNRSTESD